MKSFVVCLLIGAINCASLKQLTAQTHKWIELPNCDQKAKDWGL